MSWHIQGERAAGSQLSILEWVLLDVDGSNAVSSRVYHLRRPDNRINGYVLPCQVISILDSATNRTYCVSIRALGNTKSQ
jgi:hypothetical protein